MKSQRRGEVAIHDGDWTLLRTFLEFGADAFDGFGRGFEFFHEGFEDAHGGTGDVMFHAFDVVVNGLVVDAEELQEASQKFVASDDVVGHFFAPFGEGHAAVFLVVDETFGVEPLDHVGDAGLGDGEFLGDVDDAGVAFLRNQL